MTTALIAALAVAAPPAPPAPPIVRAPLATTAAGRPDPRIVRYEASEARCEGLAVAAIHAEQPIPAFSLYHSIQAMMPTRLSFRIDGEGRPLSIRVTSSGAELNMAGSDVVPAFAAWRFPKGEKADCEISFRPHSRSIKDAPADWLYRMTTFTPQVAGDFRGRIWTSMKPEGSDCTPPPPVRLRAYPPFDRLETLPGTLVNSMVGFDIDEEGRPQRARTLGSSGHEALDREAISAVNQSRFAGPASGCFFPYRLRARLPYAAPEAPPIESFRPEGASCSPEPGNEKRRALTNLPPLRFPEPFQRRRIEGWAVISYDIAPWGAVGNVAILAAEPAELFGQAALAIVRGAKAASGTGATGCVERVVFRLPKGAA